jgi:hypothetical protein
MPEPLPRLEPLLHEGASEVEALLLRSGQDDAPPDDAARARTLEAVKLVSQAAVAVGVGAIVWRWLTTSAAGQWFVIGGMVGGTLVASAEIVSAPVTKRPAIEAPSRTPTSTPTSTSTPTPTANAPPPVPATATAEHAPAPTRPKEMDLLESVRESLDASRATAALATLDRYDALYPSGLLAEEAAFLRIQALAASGHPADARRAADAFGRKYPGSTYAPRVPGLLEQNP